MSIEAIRIETRRRSAHLRRMSEDVLERDRLVGAFGTDQPTLRVRATDARDVLEIVTARREPVAELLDALKAVPAVRGSVLLAASLLRGRR